MRKPKKPIVNLDNYIAMDQDLRVFAGYRDGYPYWSSNMDDYKPINGTTHIHALRGWFPYKQIELITI